MAPQTIETEFQLEGLVQVRIPEAVEEPPKERVFGRWKGQIRMLPGFDDPIEGLEWAYE